MAQLCTQHVTVETAHSKIRTAAAGLLLQSTEVELNQSGCVGVFAFIERSLVPFFFTSVP